VPRVLSASVSSGVAAAVTAPGYLIEIATDPPLRYSTRGTLTYGGYPYVGGASVTSLNTSGQQTSATIVLPNADGAVGALILRGTLNDVPISIAAIYGDAPTEREVMFVGAIDSASDIGLLSCTLTLMDSRDALWSLPWLMIGPPLANHLRRPGEQIVWRGEAYLLEAGDLS
jgi:hypothetical protein